jgi:hypothetical protein
MLNKTQREKEKKRRLKKFRKSGANESQIKSWLRGWDQLDARRKK